MENVFQEEGKDGISTGVAFFLFSLIFLFCLSFVQRSSFTAASDLVA